jgi:large subunit ribosomal protein L23
MALIKGKKNTPATSAKKQNLKGQAKETKEVSVVTPALTQDSFISETHVLIRPRITEKASERAANANVYVFDVDRKATKHQISHAVQSLYKVKAVKVAIITVPAKKVFVRGKTGHTNKGKKAYVYLKKGDKIEFV